MAQNKTRIFIDGEAGTTGLQIRERLASRSDLALVSLTPDQRKDTKARRQLLNEVDIAILCLPDEAAIEAVGLIDKNAKTRVLDASSAFRTQAGWVYGFAELHTDQAQRIAAAQRVTNPGCYPQGFLALVTPLIRAGILSADYPFSYNAVSGYSGGGKKMIEAYVSAGQSASPFMPYGLNFKHKHLPEMRQLAGLTQDVLFQPAVGNYAQGMLSVVPLHIQGLKKPTSVHDIHACIAAAYHTSRFIEVAPLSEIERAEQLNPQALNGTNNMQLSIFGDEAKGQVLMMAVYDNLGKGASGAAVQNLNLMIGAAEDLSTSLLPVR